MARTRLGSAIHLCEGQADKLPFAESSFDIVVSTNAFHYFRQPEEALREFKRVLRPDGRLVITDWCDDYFACRICDRLLRIFNRAHHRIYDSVRCRSVVEAAGFQSVEVDRYKINWLWGMMTAKGLKSR